MSYFAEAAAAGLLGSTVELYALYGYFDDARPDEYDDIRVEERPSLDAFGVPSSSINNQGVGWPAERRWERLRFRSAAEVRIAQALERASVGFLPNCRARVDSCELRYTIEPDFLVLSDGRWGVLEVDGEPWHPPERAAAEHERDRAFYRHGCALVLR